MVKKDPLDWTWQLFQENAKDAGYVLENKNNSKSFTIRVPIQSINCMTNFDDQLDNLHTALEIVSDLDRFVHKTILNDGVHQIEQTTIR